jgi:hypothetical protein
VGAYRAFAEWVNVFMKEYMNKIPMFITQIWLPKVAWIERKVDRLGKPEGKFKKRWYMCTKVSLPHKGFHGNIAPHHKSSYHDELGVFWSSDALFATTARHSSLVGQAETLWGGKTLGKPCLEASNAFDLYLKRLGELRLLHLHKRWSSWIT